MLAHIRVYMLLFSFGLSVSLIDGSSKFAWLRVMWVDMLEAIGLLNPKMQEKVNSERASQMHSQKCELWRQNHASI